MAGNHVGFVLRSGRLWHTPLEGNHGEASPVKESTAVPEVSRVAAKGFVRIPELRVYVRDEIERHGEQAVA